ncbi:hypothetical protein RFI_04077 [Reticulomyxa filosa]|uniref:Uncharacterized protein n=1 Tax=Reticulomyxa filosa TaxID=46433 RepID=X6P4M8_RETFI|nr:hypothetical protein RFI_04077 [Reticulomyxa filosa]|eukprot:ETO33029.1 hypothetical protein RFI_04077 [Reticulomyxa filosa]
MYKYNNNIFFYDGTDDDDCSDYEIKMKMSINMMRLRKMENFHNWKNLQQSCYRCNKNNNDSNSKVCEKKKEINFIYIFLILIEFFKCQHPLLSQKWGRWPNIANNICNVYLFDAGISIYLCWLSGHNQHKYIVVVASIAKWQIAPMWAHLWPINTSIIQCGEKKKEKDKKKKK